MMVIDSIIQKMILFANGSSNIGSFVAGFLVFILGSLIVFFIRDYIKKPPSFSGVFYLKTTTLSSSYRAYEGLSSFYMLTLINESAMKAIGKIEKIYDIENDGQHREYVGKHRNIGDVILTVERYYLRKNKMNIHITLHGVNNGGPRGSSLIVKLETAEIKTSGCFLTTAADSSGIVMLQKEKFEEIKTS